MWRGDRRATEMLPRAQAMLGPLLDALAERGVRPVPIVYADDAIEEVRAVVAALDGLMVWVNPIQDGADRAQLDALLREAAELGVWVSAHPDVILAMGTKEVLYRTRTLGWGTDTDLYTSGGDLARRFPARLDRDRARVLKQARGNGGEGTWKVELLDTSAGGPPARSELVRARHAADRDGRSVEMSLGAFLDRIAQLFPWSGSIIDQPFADRLADGMIRCYFVHDRVVGFCHQWPQGLLPAEALTERTYADNHRMEPADTPAYRRVREQLEREWVPQMCDLLGLRPQRLPVIWDADLLYGPTTPDGNDTYVLCEINASAVWPFPPHATTAIADAAIRAIASAHQLRQ